MKYVFLLLGAFASFLAQAHHLDDDLEEARQIKKSDERAQELLVHDCKKAFAVWSKYKVDPKDEEHLDTFALLAIQGALDGNPYEVRTSVHTLGTYEMWKSVARSPRYLVVMRRLLDFAETHGTTLEPYPQDVRVAYKRFLNFQYKMKKLDPLFDNSLACQAIGDAASWFLKNEKFGLYEELTSYADTFNCGTEDGTHWSDDGMPSDNFPVLNGKFISPPEYFRKEK